MRKLTLSITAVAALTLSMFTLESSQAAAPSKHIFTLAYTLNATGTNTNAGTFELTGALEDAGAMGQEFIVLGDPSAPYATIGESLMVGAHGDISSKYGAFLHDDGSGVVMAWGMFYVTGGTGAYEGLRAVGGSVSEYDTVTFVTTGSGTGVTRGK